MTREEAKSEVDFLDYYLQNHANDYSEESHMAMRMAYKALEQEEPCEDCISRQAVLEYIEGSEAELGHGSENELVCHDIKELPSITPQPKTGHWTQISPQGIYECSECGQNIMTSDICVYKFCHGCGAKMEVGK